MTPPLTDFQTLSTVYLILFVAVAFKAFQQRNVVFNNRLAVLPTSLGLALTEFLIVFQIVRASEGDTVIEALASGWPLILAMGLGGGSGALLAMTVHGKLFKERDDAGIRRRNERLPS